MPTFLPIPWIEHHLSLSSAPSVSMRDTLFIMTGAICQPHAILNAKCKGCWNSLWSRNLPMIMRSAFVYEEEETYFGQYV
eukprot:3984498-Ditylum_brightwellii.AAC.1